MSEIFVSQNIKGKTEKEIRSEKSKALDIGQKFFDEHVKIKEVPQNKKDLLFVDKTIEALKNSDAVYFSEGWQQSGKCRLEKMVALANDMTIL